MGQWLATVAIVVPDYEAGLDFFVGTLGFELVCDIPLSPTKRWVVVRPGPGGADILLARADGDTQTHAIGNQTGGRVGFFLETDDFARDHAAMTAAGVTFLEAPRHESYGIVVKWQDPFGNLWDLLERRLKAE